MQANSIELTDSPLVEHHGVTSAEYSYTITLGPGVVRYLKIEAFLKADVEDVITKLRSLTANLNIATPPHHMYAHPTQRLVLDLAEFDSLIIGTSWESRLQMHHKLGRIYLSENMPSAVYCSFHQVLRLKDVAFDECLNAWIRNAMGNHDIVDSYRQSLAHLVVTPAGHSYRSTFVFTRTPFVRNRLDCLAQDEEERKTATELEMLRRSKFNCFIYVMEDLRNKTFKIGRSKTPGKRERTLQSEMPQIVMRFSIPGEEAHEKQLHDQFEAKRVRGEWFSLADADLLWIVEYLKVEGDASRAIVDHSWLGGVYMASSTGRPSK